jgi:hypothetical protein
MENDRDAITACRGTPFRGGPIIPTTGSPRNGGDNNDNGSEDEDEDEDEDEENMYGRCCGRCNVLFTLCNVTFPFTVAKRARDTRESLRPCGGIILIVR